MEIKDLEARLEKKQAEIEKSNRIINKYITKWGFTAEDVEIVKTSSWKEIKQYAEANWPGRWPESNDYEKRSDFEELRRKYNTLADQKTTLLKYQNQLAMMKAKEERNANTDKIPVIVEFLEDWKQSVIKFVEGNVHYIDEYYDLNSQYCDFFNSRYSFIRSGEMTEEEVKQKLSSLSKAENIAKAHISDLASMVYSYRNKTINYDRLNEILDKDVEAKYWTMVDKVTEITGEITDASSLRIAGDGNLNGIIIGTDGKAKLQTILAGGYNQNVIVNVKHGQILHYRLLVNPVR